MSMEIRNNIADLDRLDREDRVDTMIAFFLVKHCGAKYKDGMLELADHIPEEEELFPDGWREKLHSEYKKK